MLHQTIVLGVVVLGTALGVSLEPSSAALSRSAVGSQAGFVMGTVVDAGTRRGVPGALVVLRSTQGVPASVSGLTDELGRFLLAEPRSGTYRLTASATGYLPADYGQDAPSEAGTLFKVVLGEPVGGVVLRVWREASMAGRVTDQYGEPVVGTMVLAVPVERSSTTGIRFKQSTRARAVRAFTDDLGQFSLTGLSPGRYVVEVPPHSVSTPSLKGDGSRLAYWPAFHPSASALSGAAVRDLGPGDALPSVDVVVRQGRSSSLTGIVGGDSANVGRSQLRLLPDYAVGSGAEESHIIASEPVSQDGSFVLRSVPPGRYLARVWRQDTLAPVPEKSSLWGQTDLSLDEEKLVSSVAIDADRGLGLSGRVELTGAAAGPTAEGVAQLVASMVLTSWRNVFRAGASVVVRKDLSFAVEGLPPDSFVQWPERFDLQGWYFQGAEVAGRSLRGPVRVADAPNVVIVLADRPSPLAGDVRDESTAQPTPRAVVVVFRKDQVSEDMAAASTYVRMSRASAEGYYVIDHLPPGEYKVAAVREDLASRWDDSSVRGSVAASATSVTVKRGNPWTQPLRLR
jgi:hypothetical protein